LTWLLPASSTRAATSLGSHSGSVSSDIACQMLLSRCWDRSFLWVSEKHSPV
jgi:hypothetical protein